MVLNRPPCHAQKDIVAPTGSGINLGPSALGVDRGRSGTCMATTQLGALKRMGGDHFLSVWLVCVCLSCLVSLSVCLSVCQSVSQSVCRSVCLCARLFWFVCLSVCFVWFSWSVCLFGLARFGLVGLSVCLFDCLGLFSLVDLPGCLFWVVLFGWSVCLSVCFVLFWFVFQFMLFGLFVWCV